MSRRVAVLVLLVASAVWGATFPISKIALEQVHPLVFLALRFDIAAVILGIALVTTRRGRRPFRAGWSAIGTGVLVFGAMAFQFYGIQRTSASNAAFLSCLFSVFIPPLNLLLYRQFPEPRGIFALAIAVAGIVCLSATDGFTPQLADLLVLTSAALFAYQIIIVGRLTLLGQVGALELAFMQVITAAVLAHLILRFTGASFDVPFVPRVWGAIVFSGAVATALGYYVQTAVQRHMPAENAGLIYTTEIAWGGIFAWLILGEVLSARGYLGAALVLASVLIIEVRWPTRRNNLP